MKNVSLPDRTLRALLGVIALEAGYFWLAGSSLVAAYVVGGILLATAAAGFCPIYRAIGARTGGTPGNGAGRVVAAIGVLLLVVVAAGFGYASSFFTRKLFLEDFNAMNQYYKQTLFFTGRAEREKAVANYDSLLPAYRRFEEKYSDYRPHALKRDGQFAGDLRRVAEQFAAAGPLVRGGDLQRAHLDLEKARPVFQDIFRRNGFSLLSVALVDFHDQMELLLEAAQARDGSKLVALHPQVSDSLMVVESEANDAEIQSIRANLDALAALAKSGRADQLPAKADELKSSFVKVYLKRG